MRSASLVRCAPKPTGESARPVFPSRRSFVSPTVLRLPGGVSETGLSSSGRPQPPNASMPPIPSPLTFFVNSLRVIFIMVSLQTEQALPRSLRARRKLRLADDRLEFCGIKRLQRLRAHVARGREPTQATENLLLVAAQDEYAVTRTSGPELSFDGDAGPVSCLAERQCAVG